MTDIKKLTQTSREAQRLIEQNRDAIEMAQEIANKPTLQAVRTLKEDSSIKRMLKELDSQSAILRSLTGPIAELRNADLVNATSQFHDQLCKLREAEDAFNARFSLPNVYTVRMLTEEFLKSPKTEVMQHYVERASEVQRAVEAMRSPWLDTQQALSSITAFAEIQGIGSMLSKLPSFADQVSDALRVDLGDWRDKITWPESAITDLAVRAELYEGLGFDPSLTNFPASAFQETTKLAGLCREPPPFLDAYRDPVPPANSDEEEAALVRTNRAHDWLMRLETNLRNFIDTRMTATFGSDWPKQRLPNGFYDKWIAKREDAVKAGREPRPLIAYADFKEYEAVICRRDNWREVFAGYFIRPESVRESFQRLHLIRIDTMHARPIGQDDELLLYVEVQRLIRVILT